MNGMKNVKPAYAVKLGNGIFAGASYVCIKCGKRLNNYSSTPPARAGGTCPDTSSGNHIWQQC